MSGIKGAIGHLLAASGAVELGATLLSLHHQVVPPTLNLDSPDPECRFDCVPNQARAAAVTVRADGEPGDRGTENAAMVIRRGGTH